MAEKFELSFLTDKSNEDILLIVTSILQDYDWSFNVKENGKYSYWVDGPIWKFGESIEIVESKRDEKNNIQKIKKILHVISKYYSQNIVYQKYIRNKLTYVIVSIVESSTNERWKELSVAFELADLEGYNERLKDIFVCICKCLLPFYAIAAIEMKGVVDNPSDLSLNEKNFGILNYFSYKIEGVMKLEKRIDAHDIVQSEEGLFVFEKAS
ncbi:hypothetical protein LJC58_06300 [Lachnospiraceae bacterium OttesenSCG-928-D06]|nr:hypothetical protein [Lachnospiraceae bacterium OttesenSCG-928-D06]